TRPLSVSLVHRLSIASPFPYTTLFRSNEVPAREGRQLMGDENRIAGAPGRFQRGDHPAIAGADIVQADEIGMLAQEARRECLDRSEEHTSELQSRENLVCRLLL